MKNIFQIFIVKVMVKSWVIFLKFIFFTLNKFKKNDYSHFLLKNRTKLQIAGDKNLYSKKITDNKKQKIIVVIPFKDKWELTNKCLNSLLNQSSDLYSIHIVLVDNNSLEQKTFEGYEVFKSKNISHSILKYEKKFNFSEINNYAIKQFVDSQFDFILFLNNDVEFLKNSDLENLLKLHLETPNVGAVGCSLLYPNKSIQHLFIAPGVKIVASHPFRNHSPLNLPEWFAQPRAVPAVTGAVLLIKMSDFIACDMFDPHLAHSCQDLDLCLKLQNLGMVNYSHSQVFAIHYESATRKPILYQNEITIMYDKWGEHLTSNNYYSTKISRWSEDPLPAIVKMNFPWKFYIEEKSY